MFNHDSSPIPLPAPPTEPIVSFAFLVYTYIFHRLLTSIQVVDIPDIVNDITDEMSMEPPPSLDKELPKSSSTPAVSYISDDFIVNLPPLCAVLFLTQHP